MIKKSSVEEHNVKCLDGIISIILASGASCVVCRDGGGKMYLHIRKEGVWHDVYVEFIREGTYKDK